MNATTLVLGDLRTMNVPHRGETVALFQCTGVSAAQQARQPPSGRKYMPARFRSCVTETTSMPPLHKFCRMR